MVTGSPGSGKTTVIRKVAAGLPGRRLGGFYTEEIRVRGERRGFRLVTFDGKESIMAHVDIRGPHRVGRYGVNVSVIDALAESTLAVKEGVDVYLVDEIGKMECLSPRFVTAMRALLDSPKTVVAAIAQRGGGFIAEVKQRKDAELWELTRENRDGLPEQVLAWLTASPAQ
jgi:nucleoside-triphosphatase